MVSYTNFQTSLLVLYFSNLSLAFICLYVFLPRCLPFTSIFSSIFPVSCHSLTSSYTIFEPVLHLCLSHLFLLIPRISPRGLPHTVSPLSMYTSPIYFTARRCFVCYFAPVPPILHPKASLGYLSLVSRPPCTAHPSIIDYLCFVSRFTLPATRPALPG